jgi:hypothetical protein
MKVFVQASQRIRTGRIAGANFLAERGDGGIRAPVVMEQGLENIKSVLTLFAVKKGAQFHGEKRPDFANPDGCRL